MDDAGDVVRDALAAHDGRGRSAFEPGGKQGVGRLDGACRLPRTDPRVRGFVQQVLDFTETSDVHEVRIGNQRGEIAGREAGQIGLRRQPLPAAVVGWASASETIPQRPVTWAGRCVMFAKRGSVVKAFHCWSVWIRKQTGTSSVVAGLRCGDIGRGQPKPPLVGTPVLP